MIGHWSLLKRSMTLSNVQLAMWKDDQQAFLSQLHTDWALLVSRSQSPGNETTNVSPETFSFPAAKSSARANPIPNALYVDERWPCSIIHRTSLTPSRDC
jgi:hypothetical protein